MDGRLPISSDRKWTDHGRGFHFPLHMLCSQGYSADNYAAIPTKTVRRTDSYPKLP